jgi:SAM-dependent methyltransferase
MATPPDPTRRFSDRVADYVRYRPGYPPALIESLVAETGISAGSLVADVGSGTGISTECLLGAGCTVFAVEPNREMRAAAERRLAARPGFRSVAGTAEATGLPEASVDLVTAGQAFHWFDVPRSRAEFRRILRPPRPVALFWNRRLRDATAFLAAYEALLQEFGTDYAQVHHEGKEARLAAELAPGPWREFTFPNVQQLDLAGLEGRALSSSYVPAAADPRRAPLRAALRRLFETHQENGRVRILYEAVLFLGTIP